MKNLFILSLLFIAATCVAQDSHDNGVEISKGVYLIPGDSSNYPATEGFFFFSQGDGVFKFYQNGSFVELGSGSATWGSIAGTITNQSDLQTQLDSLGDNTFWPLTGPASSAGTNVISVTDSLNLKLSSQNYGLSFSEAENTVFFGNPGATNWVTGSGNFGRMTYTHSTGQPPLFATDMTGQMTNDLNFISRGWAKTHLGSRSLSALGTSPGPANDDDYIFWDETAGNYDLKAPDWIPLTGGTFTGDISVPDEVYGVGWNASVEVPTKNALYDKIETLSGDFWSLSGNFPTANGQTITLGYDAIFQGSSGGANYQMILLNDTQDQAVGITDGGDIFFSNISGTASSGVRILGGSLGSVTIQDDRASPTGIQDQGDYSGTYTSLSHANAGYVDSNLGGNPLSSIAQSPGASEDGKVLAWDNANTQWDTVSVSGGGAVSSVFSRTGAVTAQSGDYTAAQVTNAFDKTADDAADVPYTPTTTGDWPGTDPNDVEEALDSLASRVLYLETQLAAFNYIGIDTVHIKGWNMNVSGTGSGSTTVDLSGIISADTDILNVDVLILNDAGGVGYQAFAELDISGSCTDCISLDPFSSTTITINHFGAGAFFDSVNFNDDTVNRGYVTVTYLR